MIIVINGPPGVGKTTVSKALAKLVSGTVCIHGDHLRAFAPEDAQTHLGGGSTYRAAATLACAYLGMGASRVIFDYCFLRPRQLRARRASVPGLASQISSPLFTMTHATPNRPVGLVPGSVDPAANAAETCSRAGTPQLALVARLSTASTHLASTG
jgi:hypothetical protein